MIKIVQPIPLVYDLPAHVYLTHEEYFVSFDAFFVDAVAPVALP